MIRDLEKERPDPLAETDRRADVCVIGAGAAGITLAIELVGQGKRVVLLEGGGSTIEERSQEPYRSEVVGLRHRGIHTGRFRAVGGTTTRWGGQILELDARDFERREGIPDSGWPISKAELAPYYARALELEGLAGVVRDDESVWRAIGLEPPAFAPIETYFSRWCPQPNFAVLHGETLRNADGLEVWLHANAVEALFADGQMTGVRARTLGGIEHVFEAGRFVFALGTIECCRFFLQPQRTGIGWNRSGLLGRHFQDHIDVNAATVHPIDAARFHRCFDNVFSKGYKYHPKLRLGAEAQVQLGTLNVAGTMAFSSSADEALAAIKTFAKKMLRGRFGEIGGVELRTFAKNLPLVMRQVFRYVFQSRAYNPPEAKILLRVHCEQQPDSMSSIELADTRDSLGMLRTRLDWRISEHELATIRQYVLVAQQALQGVARIEPDAALISGEAEFVQRCDDCNHHMGGMKMATEELDGVVDPNLRLHGTENVYILSGAVFPTSGYSNPTHTLLALAVRLSRYLTGQAD